MKQFVIIALTVFLTWSAQAQGSVAFANNTSTRIINAETGLGADNSIRVQLYWADGANADMSTLRSVTNAPISVAAAGIFSDRYRILGTSEHGGMATVQVRAWTAALGADYETARANWLAGDIGCIGESVVFNIRTAALTSAAPPLPASLVRAGLQSFTILCLPEPSTIALSALAGLLLVFLPRRHP